MSLPTRFILIRHAQTKWNHEQRYAGSSEVPLSDEAHEQIGRLAAKLADKKLDAAYSSPLTRCQLTIGPTAKAHNLPITILPELKERNLGAWEGKAAHELDLHHGGYQFPVSAYDGSFRIPKAETIEAAEHRIRTALRAMAEAHPGETVLVGTHGGIIRILLQHIVANPPDEITWPGNCARYHLLWNNGHCELEEIHDGW